MIEKYPELKDRIQASFIDAMVVLAMIIAFTWILDKYENVPDWITIAMFAGTFIIYEPVCMVLGCTLGNYVKGIRVRKNADSTRKINILQAIIRYPVKIFLGWISFLTIGADAKKRAIHDMVAGTVMIKL